MAIDTPCTAVCFIDPTTDLCAGCGRTLPEIASWHRLDREARLAIMAQLPDRMTASGMVQIANKKQK